MAEGNDNGRVTMAVLSTKLDTVIQRLDELAKCAQHDHDVVVEHTQVLEDRGRRIAVLESQAAARTWETRIVELLLAVATGIGFIKGS